MNVRVGFGYDVHPFELGRKMFLGGVEIPFEYGLKGHSDADVLIHAICDAILGAAGMRDIGYHFPDHDAELKNIDSKIILRKTVLLVFEKGYKIGNIDCTLCAEMPIISPYVEEMRNTLAQVIEIPIDCISIKATTNEKLGFVGRKEGIAAYAIALINHI